MDPDIIVDIVLNESRLVFSLQRHSYQHRTNRSLALTMQVHKRDLPQFISIHAKEIASDLKCAVCLGVLVKTTLVAECLHRFCAECLTTALRRGKKECPACRAPCPSKRHLRSDPAFDALIALVYPDADALVDDIVPCASLRENARLNSPTASSKQHKANLKALQKASLDSIQTMSTTSEQDSESDLMNKPDIEFSNADIPWNLEVEMRVDPRTGVSNNTPFVLRTLRDCIVQHLAVSVSSFLTRNLPLGTVKWNVAIHHYDGSTFRILSPHETLGDISTSSAQSNYMTLYWSVVPEKLEN